MLGQARVLWRWSTTALSAAIREISLRGLMSRDFARHEGGDNLYVSSIPELLTLDDLGPLFTWWLAIDELKVMVEREKRREGDRSR